MSEDAQTPFTPSPISVRAATALAASSAGASALLLMCVHAQLLWPGRCSRARAPQPSAAAARPPPAACASRAGARATRRSAYQRRLTSRRRAPSTCGRARAPRPRYRAPAGPAAASTGRSAAVRPTPPDGHARVCACRLLWPRRQASCAGPSAGTPDPPPAIKVLPWAPSLVCACV